MLYQEILKLTVNEIMAMRITDKNEAAEIIADYKLSHGERFSEDLRHQLKLRYYNEIKK